MNIDNMARLELRLRNLVDEEEYDQETWMEKRGSCGTAACLAGHAVLMEGLKPVFGESMYLPSYMAECAEGPNGRESIRLAAKRILDLDSEEADALFAPDPTRDWPSEFKLRWRRRHETGEKKSVIAADLIHAMIVAGGVMTL